MKMFQQIWITFGIVIGLLFFLANWMLLRQEEPDGGRPYRVEIHRIALLIAEQGPEAVDLSVYTYVTGVTQMKADAAGDFDADSDYLVREINGALYRFDYTAQPSSDKSGVLVLVNGILAVMAAGMIAVFLFIRQKILRPFEKLTDVPYELAKGNLTVPLQEEKSRFYGRFVWGMDMLRESIEQQKRREFALQREKKTLLLSLSHDIKTPLSAIKLYAKALSKGLYPNPEKQQDLAERINAKADEIETYVTQIMQASKKDFLTLEVHTGEFYLSALIQSIRVYYEEKLALLQTEFTLAAYTDCLLRGDFDRSVEVLQNMMENALKYGDGKRICIAFTEEDGCVLIAIENSGCTLPPSELPHIFDSFWRGSNAGSVPGSGLGLSICRQLMHKMNGEIFADAREGTMTVTAVFGKA